MGADPRSRLIVALDVATPASALEWVGRLGDDVWFYKVGLELFVAAGPAIVKELVDRGKRVFVDLKLHDIPNTVGSTCRVLAQSGASMATVHASGGTAMLRAAAEAVAGSPLRLLAVTVLTSLGQSDLLADGQSLTVEQLVEARASLARTSGIHGVVCSPLEAERARRILGKDGLIVTPGVRPAGPHHDDQQRTATAARAIEAGASHVVVGRPILQAQDPLAAVRGLLAELRDP